MTIRRRIAFSLVELSVVLLILAIAAGAIVLRVSGPMHRAQMNDAVDQVRSFDTLTRQIARQQGRPIQTVFHVGSGRISRTDSTGREGVGSVIELPGDFVISRLAIDGRTLGSGQAAVGFSSQGFSGSYAVRISGPSGQERWLLLAGLSGQPTELGNETEVDAYFAALR